MNVIGEVASIEYNRAALIAIYTRSKSSRGLQVELAYSLRLPGVRQLPFGPALAVTWFDRRINKEMITGSGNRAARLRLRIPHAQVISLQTVYEVNRQVYITFKF